MAIAQQRPFKDKGSGFQDAVILLAAVSHAAKSTDKAAVFVSRDGGFTEDVIEALTSPSLLKMTLFRDLDKLNDVLMEELRGRVRDEWVADTVRAVEAVEENREELQKFITDHFEVPERLGFFRTLRIFRLLGLKIVAIEAVHTPAPWTRDKGQTEITISAD